MVGGLIACTCGGTLPPNTSCGCTIGERGGITACDGFQQSWPVSAIIAIDSVPTSWTTIFGLAGGGVLPSSVTDETTYAAWLAASGSTFEVDFQIKLESTDVIVDMTTSWACGEEIAGTYRRIVDTDGHSYLFDTVTGTGLPVPSVSATLSAVYKHANNTGFYESLALAPDSISILYEAFASATNGSQVGLRTKGTFEPPYYRYQNTSTPGRTFTQAVCNNSVPMTPIQGGVLEASRSLTDTELAQPTSGSAPICLGTASTVSTRPIVSGPAVPFRGWRSPDANNYAFGYRNYVRRTASTGSIPLSYQANPLRITGTIHAASPSNPGCQSCPRFVRVRLTETLSDTTTAVYDRILAQACATAAGGPTSGWPYACDWAPVRALSGDTNPLATLSLRRVGPKQWNLAPGGTGAPIPVKWEGECPVGMTDVMQTVDVADKATTSSTTGGTVLVTSIARTLLVEEAAAEYCPDCACDPACDPCGNCLTAPETIGVRIRCRRYVYNAETDENELVDVIDVTIAYHRTDAQPCHYETSIGSGDNGFVGEIAVVDGRYKLTGNKTGTGSFEAGADCGTFDITQLDWSLVSATFGEEACDEVLLEVG